MGFYFCIKIFILETNMRKSFRGVLACSEVSPGQMCFGFGGNIKSLLEIWEACVVLCVSAGEVA